MNLRHIGDTLRAISIRGCGAGLAVVGTVAGLAVAPQSVEAAQSGVATISVVVVPGSLSAGAVDNASALLRDSGGVASSASPLNSLSYSDATGSSSGWNATLALQRFVSTTPWAGTGRRLSDNGSGRYEGPTVTAAYEVTVLADQGNRVVIGWSGAESGSGEVIKGAPAAVGTCGVTIVFDRAVEYSPADQYTMHADLLPRTALVLAPGAACLAQGSTAGGRNLPVLTNTSATVVGGTAESYGAPIRLVVAARGAGRGSFVCTPQAMIATDSSGARSLSYTGTAEYSIVTGP